MFVRKKTNRSGTISVVVVSKAHVKFTEVKKFGVAKSDEESDELFRKAQLWLQTNDGQQKFDFDDRKVKEVNEAEHFLSNIDNVLINGTQLLLNQVYDSIGFNRIYRYMDKLNNTKMELAQQISVEHTRKLFGDNIGLMFYDITTLYFETGDTDVLREPDFSKDGKTAESQVVLGLLVSEGGYPLSYSLFNGSQDEGHHDPDDR